MQKLTRREAFILFRTIERYNHELRITTTTVEEKRIWSVLPGQDVPTQQELHDLHQKVLQLLITDTVLGATNASVPQSGGVSSPPQSSDGTD